MTPAIKAAEKAMIRFTVHEYEHDPAARSYGEEAAAVLKQNPERVLKTLVVALNGNNNQLAVGIVPVSKQLDLKNIAAAAGAKKAAMADVKAAERTTGYVLGGISPLGQKKRLPTVVDTSALRFETVFVSAGRRGLEIELAPGDLLKLCSAQTAPIAR